MLQSLTPLREYNEKLSNPILRQFKTFEPDSTRRRGHFCKFPRLIFNSLPLCKIQSTLLPLFACISLVWSFPCTFVYKSLLIFYYAYVLHQAPSSPSCPAPFPLGYWPFSHTIANILAAITHIIFYMPFSTCSQNQKNISDAFNPTFYLLQSAKLLIAIC